MNRVRVTYAWKIRCGIIELSSSTLRMGGRESGGFGLFGRPHYFSTCVLGSEDPVVPGTHGGRRALSPARLGLGWLLVQVATLFSVILVLLTQHLEEHAAEGLRSFQLSFVPDVASGFSAS